MNEQKVFDFPTEEVELPSKGLLYPKDNPLSSGKIRMKYGTTREEDILTNGNYIKQGIVLDKLLQSMVVDKVNLDDLLAVDKDALLVASRILMWGSDYKVSIKNPNDKEGEPIIHTINLTEIKEKEIDPSLIKSGVNEFTFLLPHTNTNITFKLLTVKDEKDIENEIKGLKKAGLNPSEMSTRLKFTIKSVNGERTQSSIRNFVDGMIARDSKALREYIKKIQPGINLSFKYDFGNGEVEVPIPLTIEFFWPSNE